MRQVLTNQSALFRSRVLEKKWASPGLFYFIFVISIQLTVNVQYKFLPMTGFEPQTSQIGSNHSTNWATTTARVVTLLWNFLMRLDTVRTRLYMLHYGHKLSCWILHLSMTRNSVMKHFACVTLGENKDKSSQTHGDRERPKFFNAPYFCRCECWRVCGWLCVWGVYPRQRESEKG